MSEQVLLEAVDLHKRYRGTPVVRGVSLQVVRGQVVGLLGPNGAGKTTCFHMIVGVEPPDSGVLSLLGKDMTYLAIHQRVHLGLGYLPQESSVFRKLSVRDNLLAVLEVRPNLNRRRREERATKLMAEFGLQSLSQSMAAVLSGGERRRLEIARTLALDPSVVLLDEPFAGVDPIAVNDVKRLVSDLRARNIGVLLTDHNVREALDLCDYAYVLHGGVVCAEGTSDAIVKNKTVRAVYLGKDF